MGTKGKSKDPENISIADAASGSSLENNFRLQIAQIKCLEIQQTSG
jgi:hypothetical protein